MTRAEWVMAEMGFTPPEMTGIALISSLPGVVAHISEELETKTRILIVPDDVAYHPRARHDLDRSSARAPTRRATRTPSRPRLPTCYASAACWASRSAWTGFLNVPFQIPRARRRAPCKSTLVGAVP